MTDRTYPVAEIFGPTVQGEGPATGERCWFLRLGGCDYRCAWCDSMYAVDPAIVRTLPRMAAADIAERLVDLGCVAGGLLIVSGGNPALHHLDAFLDELGGGPRVHVETQGTVFRPWLNRAELVVVSPKPPSAFADMRGDASTALRAAWAFIGQLRVSWALKIVVFDDDDLAFAVEAHDRLVSNRPAAAPPPVGCYLSAGTDQGGEPRAMVDAIVDRFAWLANEHVARLDLAPFRIGAQMHVLAWPGELAR